MSMPETIPIRRRAIPLVLSAVAILLVGATLLLWAHYGSAVFLEMIRAGIAACFG